MASSSSNLYNFSLRTFENVGHCLTEVNVVCNGQMHKFESRLAGILDMIEDTDSAHVMTSMVTSEEEVITSDDDVGRPASKLTFTIPLYNVHFPALLATDSWEDGLR